MQFRVRKSGLSILLVHVRFYGESLRLFPLCTGNSDTHSMGLLDVCKVNYVKEGLFNPPSAIHH